MSAGRNYEWIVGVWDSDRTERFEVQRRLRSPEKLTTLATRAISSEIPWVLSGNLGEHIPKELIGKLREGIAFREIKQICGSISGRNVAFAVRVALVYLIMQKYWPTSEGGEILQKLQSLLTRGENLTYLPKLLSGPMEELDRILRLANPAVIEWFIARGDYVVNQDPLGHVRFFFHCRNGKELMYDNRFWEYTEYQPNCGQIVLSRNNRDRACLLGISTFNHDYIIPFKQEGNDLRYVVAVLEKLEYGSPDLRCYESLD